MPGFEIIDKKERLAVEKIFKEGGVLFAHGFDRLRKKFHVREFEHMFSKKFKSKYCLAVTSGTAAIKIGLKRLGVKRGDEVITQSFNFVATVEAIIETGATPIIANVDKTLNIDIKDVKRLITKKTKVILPVHMLGVAADMNAVNRLAKRHKLKVLEDNCESIGGKYNKKFLGTLGDVGALSFDFGKIITTGEGGMVLTNKKQFDKYAREYHDHGHENNPLFPRGRDTKKISGFNYRMTEMQAAVGKVQLKKLDKIIKNNKKRYITLEKQLKKRFEIRKITPLCSPIYDAFIFFVENSKLRKKIIKVLQANGFGTKNLPDAIEWHCSAYWSHALSKKQVNHSKITKKLLSKSIAIPIWLKKSLSEYSIIGKKIKDI